MGESPGTPPDEVYHEAGTLLHRAFAAIGSPADYAHDPQEFANRVRGIVDYVWVVGVAEGRRQEAADLEVLQRENAELNGLFAMQWDRMTEATALWRAEDPEARALVMPDLGSLLQWLMDRLVTPPGQRAVTEQVEPCAYVSTACQHNLHEKCRANCKYCGTLCGCLVPDCGHPVPGRRQ